MEKISKRVNAIEEVNNNVKLLTEMVTNYSKGETTESNEDLMKVRRGLGLAGMSDRYPPEFLLPVLHHSRASHCSPQCPFFLSPRSCISAASA